MILTELITYLTQLGYSFICCNFKNLWDGIEKGSPNCIADECGGPIKGMGFPRYIGPLVGLIGVDITGWCFVCGDNKVTHLVHTKNRKLALCQVHYDDKIWKGDSKNSRTEDECDKIGIDRASN